MRLLLYVVAWLICPFVGLLPEAQAQMYHGTVETTTGTSRKGILLQLTPQGVTLDPAGPVSYLLVEAEQIRFVFIEELQRRFVYPLTEADVAAIPDELLEEKSFSHIGRGSVGPDRGGFTLLLSLGLGLQNDRGLEESTIGLAGLNLGIGRFLNDNVALMIRVSGTNASYDIEGFDFRQVSGVGAVSLQYWVDDKLQVEGGPGFGFWSISDLDSSDSGFGLFLGAGYTLLNSGKHNLHIGLEYAPAFTDGGTVHNLGFVLGYQLL